MQRIEEQIQITQVENTGTGKKVRIWAIVGGILPIGFIRYNKTLKDYAFYGVNGVGYSWEVMEYISKFIKKIK